MRAESMRSETSWQLSQHRMIKIFIYGKFEKLFQKLHKLCIDSLVCSSFVLSNVDTHSSCRGAALCIDLVFGLWQLKLANKTIHGASRERQFRQNIYETLQHQYPAETVLI